MARRSVWILGAVVAAAAACGACGKGGGQVAPDAPPADGAPDTTMTFAACHEFETSAITVPMHHEGVLAGADVESPSMCAHQDAPYGLESAGPDSVVEVAGLVPEMPYVVHLASSADLSFYVVTGCAGDRGPTSAQCLLFEDASTGTEEVGTFIAPASTVYVVVDYYASAPPADTTFAIDVYPRSCTTSAQCTGGTPVCDDGECVACASSFDCKSAVAPRCDVANHLCDPGVDQCAADDSAEPADDGPAGATLLVPDGDGTAQRVGQICAMPQSERDYLAFDVTTLGETWDLSLAWAGSRDLDLEVLDATGASLGLSYWEQSEHVRLTYLPLGRYYVRINEFSQTPDPSPVTYTLTSQRSLGAGCTAASDCAGEYRNQLFRGSCVAGACVDIAGAGTVAQGGACDSQSDCVSGLDCPSFFFVSGADTRDVCAPTCATDTDCAALGSNYTCTTYLQHNFCVQKCTTDQQCPTVVNSQPQTGPWYRLSCQQSTGRCLP